MCRKSLKIKKILQEWLQVRDEQQKKRRLEKKLEREKELAEKRQGTPTREVAVVETKPTRRKQSKVPGQALQRTNTNISKKLV